MVITLLVLRMNNMMLQKTLCAPEIFYRTPELSFYPIRTWHVYLAVLNETLNVVVSLSRSLVTAKHKGGSTRNIVNGHPLCYSELIGSKGTHCVHGTTRYAVST